MDITPYVESLRRDLLAAAEGAGDEARQIVERLAFAIDPAARLAIMEAVSEAAAEITAEMPAGGVDVRLSGRELDFVVDTAAPEAPAAPPAPPADEPEGLVADPLAQAFILTAIVIGFGVLAFAVVLIRRAHEVLDVDDFDELKDAEQ